MSNSSRLFAEGWIPFVDVQGTTCECGQALGCVWQEALRLAAQEMRPGSKPWWRDKRFARIIDRCAPHLPDLYRSMARGAGLKEDQIGAWTLEPKRSRARAEGCTSFAIAPRAALDRQPISGQTKDTAASRQFQFQVLRLALTDAPGALTLTYPGWLFGHGFVRGGCAVFRNSLYAGDSEGTLPYHAWGVLALHCPTVDHVVELSRRYGVRVAGHCTIADAKGGIVGLEFTQAGVVVLRPKQAIYTHANCVAADSRALRYEACDVFSRDNSLHRERRLRELLEPDRGRLTAQLVFQALADHDEYPVSICRHQSEQARTTAAVVVEPARNLLHACRGNPCQNWPKTYAL